MMKFYFAFCVFLFQMIKSEVFLKGTYIEVGIHDSASYGTYGSPPSGYHAKGDRSRSGLGFVADMEKNGWTTGTPNYCGDYFLPGSPLEGWSVEWNIGSSQYQYINKGRVGKFNVPKTSLTKISTDSASLQVARWVGTAASKLKIEKTIQFMKDKTYFTTYITMQNVGSQTLSSVEYMRNVDPDQAQPWGGGYSTKNWVDVNPETYMGTDGKWKSDKHGRYNRDYPNMALVVAKGRSGSYEKCVMGLGTISPYARVNHFGFQNNDPDTVWTNNDWKRYSESSPRSADEGTNLGFRWAELKPGDSVSFSFAYVLSQSDIIPAMKSMSELVIVQPTDMLAGKYAVFVARTSSMVDTEDVEFFIQPPGVSSPISLGKCTAAATAICVPRLGDEDSGIYTLTFDSYDYTDVYGNGVAYNFEVVAEVSGQVLRTSKSAIMDNNGPKLQIEKPLGSAISIGSTIEFQVKHIGGDAPTKVRFYREITVAGKL
eukprot:TRINITY_DN4294_c1_g1_i5.p1 TRINITY_DN4294_c1_g1~~TRINITY_DN4294_c1_g1_i5.p1  ORF type:complete len:485 (+),score=107.97 TRINITY_DN4294_c1_g1_i5:83-1537(+)